MSLRDFTVWEILTWKISNLDSVETFVLVNKNIFYAKQNKNSRKNKYLSVKSLNHTLSCHKVLPFYTTVITTCSEVITIILKSWAH